MGSKTESKIGGREVANKLKSCTLCREKFDIFCFQSGLQNLEGNIDRVVVANLLNRAAIVEGGIPTCQIREELIRRRGKITLDTRFKVFGLKLRVFFSNQGNPFSGR